MTKDAGKDLALYCAQHLDDGAAFERLCREIRPLAYGAMKLHKNVIPYYDKDDYLQEAYITLYRVLMRIAVQPEIAESFWAYLWVSIKNAYCHLFRDYVLHHLVVVHTHDAYEGNYNYTQMVYFHEYADAYYRKHREYQRQYYQANRERILEKQRQTRLKQRQGRFEGDLADR